MTIRRERERERERERKANNKKFTFQLRDLLLLQLAMGKDNGLLLFYQLVDLQIGVHNHILQLC